MSTSRNVNRTEYLVQLQTVFSAAADPNQAVPMARYMRNRFEFLGVKSPTRKTLLREFISLRGLPSPIDLDKFIRDLWHLPQREYQYVALDVLDRMRRYLTAEHVDLLEFLIVTKSWWDTVDNLASHPVGDLFRRDPRIRAEMVERWRRSPNIWLRRTTLLFQLRYKKETDEALLFDLVRDNLDSDAFFIQKAIGWALREYSKTAPDAVRHFIAQTDLSSLSVREGMKWLNRQT